MMEYSEVEAQFHSFLTLVLASTLCNVTQHINFCIILNFGTRWWSLVNVTSTTALPTAPSIHYSVGLAGSKAGLDDLGDLSLRGTEPWFLGRPPVVYSLHDYARLFWIDWEKSQNASNRTTNSPPVRCLNMGPPDWKTPRLDCSAWSLTCAGKGLHDIVLCTRTRLTIRALESPVIRTET
jgi:hypothetical protein